MGEPMRVDGLRIANNIHEEIHALLAGASRKATFVLLNDHPASLAFVNRKVALAEKLGIGTEIIKENILHTDEAISLIAHVHNTDGVVVQLPLPETLDTHAILNSLAPHLDVDLLGDQAKTLFMHRESHRFPPVAYAVKRILEEYNILLKEKRIVVLGKGKLVGEPVGLWLQRESIPFEFIDVTTGAEERAELLSAADIIISGVGQPHIIKPEHIQKGVVLIDAGTSESRGKLVGDIDPACEDKAHLFTPVPGGVGPLTVASLFRNLVL
jgi:methylenetetrahydrofolate dehydrogenase (NADP+)/methenyltetrahydrofolate cyclohydrolase